MDHRYGGRRPAIRPATTLPIGTLAVGLAALALASHLAAGRAERRHPPRGRFITVDGVRLHLLEQGQGSPSYCCTATAPRPRISPSAVCWTAWPRTTASSP